MYRLAPSLQLYGVEAHQNSVLTEARLMKTKTKHQIVVVSPDDRISDFLESRLAEDAAEIINCEPGEEFIRQASRAQIAVIDRINERPENARLEITMLRRNDPAVPVIAVSERSSDRDAEVVNQGLFYYLAGYSEQKLLRIVQAAIDSLESQNETPKAAK